METAISSFGILVLIVAFLAGAVAAVAGFGIGSLLTSLLSLTMGTKLAVAAVSVPHLAGTALRFWRLRGHMDRRVLLDFGLASAAGGLTGALLHGYANNPALETIFGALLVLAGVLGLTGLTDRLRFRGAVARVAGVFSGLFGGLVGNQGGIRSAALLSFDLPKEGFVATATAIALVVDGVRMPVYFLTAAEQLLARWPPVAVAVVGVLFGTLAGERLLRRVPEVLFRRTVATVILLLGIAMLARVIGQPGSFAAAIFAESRPLSPETAQGFF
jgi:uncharacterized membrane protein YfcA